MRSLESRTFTWIAAPSDARLRKASIVVTTARRMISLEQLALKMISKLGSLADFFARLQLRGRDIYDEKYYPIGGLQRVSGTRSKIGVIKALSCHKEKVIEFIFPMCSIIHVVVQSKRVQSENLSANKLGLLFYLLFKARKVKTPTHITIT